MGGLLSCREQERPTRVLVVVAGHGTDARVIEARITDRPGLDCPDGTRAIELDADRLAVIDLSNATRLLVEARGVRAMVSAEDWRERAARVIAAREAHQRERERRRIVARYAHSSALGRDIESGEDETRNLAGPDPPLGSKP